MYNSLTAESPHAELLFRTVHSANQFSIYGGAPSWCEELAQLIPGQTHVIMEQSFARTISYHKNWSRKKWMLWYKHRGGMMRQRETGCVIIFKDLKNWRKRSNSRMRRVFIGMRCKTLHDLKDGFGGRTGACREYSLLREDPDSELIAWIGGHTKIGPVLQVKTTC